MKPKSSPICVGGGGGIVLFLGRNNCNIVSQTILISIFFSDTMRCINNIDARERIVLQDRNNCNIVTKTIFICSILLNTSLDAYAISIAGGESFCRSEIIEVLLSKQFLFTIFLLCHEMYIAYATSMCRESRFVV